MRASRLGAGWAAVVLLLLSLGLPWTGPRQIFTPGTGPSCIADLSGEGGLICNYISIGGGTEVVAGVNGSQTPARFFLVLAIVLVLWGVATGRRSVLGVAGAVALSAVGLGLPTVLSGQVAALAAAAILLFARRAHTAREPTAPSRSADPTSSADPTAASA